MFKALSRLVWKSFHDATADLSDRTTETSNESMLHYYRVAQLFGGAWRISEKWLGLLRSRASLAPKMNALFPNIQKFVQ